MISQINEDIKTGKFKPVYLLYGEESYLKRQYRDRLKSALLTEDSGLNYTYYEGKGTDPGEVIAMAETMPYFAERRLVVVENSGFFKRAEPALAEYLTQMLETSVLIFVENEVDKRGKLFKTVNEIGRAVAFSEQKEQTLLYWIAGMVNREGKKIRESTATYLLSQVGTDMERLNKELEKLVSYTMGRDEVTRADVDAVCSVQLTNRIFDMVEAVASGRQREALDGYYDLLALKEPPMRIFFLLCRQFRLLLEVRGLLAQGMDKTQIAKTCGFPPFAASKYIRQCRRFSKETLLQILEDAAESEERVKTGRLADRLCVELFLMKYSEGESH